MFKQNIKNELLLKPQSLILYILQLSLLPQWHQVIFYMRTEHKVICICEPKMKIWHGLLLKEPRGWEWKLSLGHPAFIRKGRVSNPLQNKWQESFPQQVRASHKPIKHQTTPIFWSFWAVRQVGRCKKNSGSTNDFVKDLQSVASFKMPSQHSVQTMW